MMAISMALERGHHVTHNTTIMIATDNVSVVSYIIKQGGEGGGRILQPCVWRFRTSYCGVIKREITWKVRHIPGRFNILAEC